MAKRSKLLVALDAQKGRDYEAERKKKQVKAAEKRKQDRSARKQLQTNLEAEDGDEKENVKVGQADAKSSLKSILKSTKELPSQKQSTSEAEVVGVEAEDDNLSQHNEVFDESASSVGENSDIPVSDLEDEDLEDIIRYQRMTINNGPALTASRKRVTVAKSSMPFHYHNSLISSLPPASEVIPDAMDDLTREAEFYRIAREGAIAARASFKKENVPFTRPADYFAEMVKSDEHMGKIKKKLYDQAADRKGREEARKLRDARKFGKQVQIAKEQERAREKRETLDKIKELKRKRKGNASANTTEGDDLFQEISIDHSSNKRSRDRESANGPAVKRQKRDAKYGFGGKKRFAKSGDAVSSADMGGFSSRGMKDRTGGSTSGKKRPTTKRLGKSRRVGARG